MKITFECVESGSRGVMMQQDKSKPAEKKLVYFANFGVANQKEGKDFGKIEIESLIPLHFKATKKYDVNITEHSGIAVVSSIPPPIPKKGNN